MNTQGGMVVAEHDPLFICKRILAILLQYRRGLTTAAHDCYAPQLEQIRQQVIRNQPLLLTLPAFPCKSPNRHKVLGELPDMAERMSLRFLKQLCDAIGQIYPPGARVLVCSDGHVFGDLIQVTDATIRRYATALSDMVEQESIACIHMFHLTDVYGRLDDQQMRQRLESDWSRPVHLVHDAVRNDAAQLHLYRGITRFLFEDALDTTTLSKSALQRLSRKRAVSVIQRSQAWGNLIQHCFPLSLRLSIHPQPANSAKLGIMLLNAPDIWMTPWHAVLVQSHEALTLMKHYEAKQVGKLVRIGGRPSHYQIPA